jgi:hypothetical protein
MRKGTDSSRRQSMNYASRGMRHPRRREAVWFVPHVASGFSTEGQPHHTSGALALDPRITNPEAESAIPRCALVVERDPALAQSLTRALQASFGPIWSVRCVSDSRLLASPSQNDTPELIILDASWPGDNDVHGYRSLSALPDLSGVQTIYVTPDTSYRLSQRGVSSGVILREWRHLDDIVAVVAEVIAGGENGA